MKNFIKAFCFIIIGLMIMVSLGKLHNPVGTVGQWFNPIKDFYYRDKDTIDIIYVGDSNVYAGISPLEIYSKNGVTGYSYSSPEQKVWSSYYLAKEAFKTQKPKVLFLETGEFFDGPDDYQPEFGARNPIDALKFSKNKLDMINDKDYKMSEYDKLSCVFPEMRYHSRWSQLTEIDIRKFINYEQHSFEGYSLNTTIKSYDKKKNHKKKNHDGKDQDKTEISEASLEKINKIIKLCNDNNCQLVLLSMPEPLLWNIDQHNSIQKLADENNLKFIDLNNDDNIQIDWEDDSFDSGSHLNIYGAEKVATYLTNYINTNFNLPDHRQDSKYEKWNEDLARYNQEKLKYQVQ